MKKSLLFFTALLTSNMLLAQIQDTVKIAVDTIPKTAAPVAPTEPKAEKQGRPWSEKIAFGFGTGFWITPNTTYIEIDPSIAYRFPKTLITGIGFRYIYRHDRVINNDLHSYGPNVFARVNLTKRIYLWTEYEYLYSQYFDYKYGNSDNYTRETANYDSWFAGIGYQRSVGKKGRGGISVQFLYNFLYDHEDQYNPYYSAYTYRVGYFF